jgi:hypothetical protein
MRANIRRDVMLAAVTVIALGLGACASEEDVKKAQATADAAGATANQALAMAQQAHSSAQNAQQTADAANANASSAHAKIAARGERD